MCLFGVFKRGLVATLLSFVASLRVPTLPFFLKIHSTFQSFLLPRLLEEPLTLPLPVPTFPISAPSPSSAGIDQASRLDRPDLQVYQRRTSASTIPQVEQAPVPSTTAPVDSSPVPVAPTVPDSPSDLDMPIALRKGTRTCTAHPISNFLSTRHLSPSYTAFVTSLSSVSIPKSMAEALSHPGWRAAMAEGPALVGWFNPAIVVSIQL